MKVSVHVQGNMVRYEYQPDAGSVLARTWRQQNGVILEVCFHCDRAGRADGELDGEIPHDADQCDLCGAKVLPGEGPFDLEGFLNNPNPKVFRSSEVVRASEPFDVDEFNRIIREGRDV